METSKPVPELWVKPKGVLSKDLVIDLILHRGVPGTRVQVDEYLPPLNRDNPTVGTAIVRISLASNAARSCGRRAISHVHNPARRRGYEHGWNADGRRCCIHSGFIANAAVMYRLCRMRCCRLAVQWGGPVRYLVYINRGDPRHGNRNYGKNRDRDETRHARNQA
jgi:hypothetical protein